MSVTVKKMVITPDKAKKWLEKNKNNRPLKKRNVAALVQAIRRNEWKENGETIKFNCDGSLVDGQNRLTAIVVSGQSIVSHVAYGVPEEAFDTIDQGAPRTLSDVFARRGEVNYGTLATATRTLWLLENNWTIAGAQRFRNQQGIELLEANPTLRRSVKKILNTDIQSLMSPGIVSALHYSFSRKDRALADEFCLGVCDGENIRRGTNAYGLRSVLIQNKVSVEKFSRDTIIAYWIKGWNAERAGEVVGRYVFKAGDSYPEIQ